MGWNYFVKPFLFTVFHLTNKHLTYVYEVCVAITLVSYLVPEM